MISPKPFFVIVLCALLAALRFTCHVSAANPPERPNIIFMMADDMGWGMVDFAQQRSPDPSDPVDAVFAGHPELKTPELDAMRQAGLKFNRMYSQSPVCSPTRASFVTGRAPRRLSIDAPNDGKLMNMELTIYEIAKTQGYTTGHFGKWHLGTLTKTMDERMRARDGNHQEYSTPWHSGVDRTYAIESSPPTFDPMIDPSTGSYYDPGARLHYWTGTDQYIPHDADELQGDTSDILVRETEEFISDALAAQQPFLAVTWFQTPHATVVKNQSILEELYTQDQINAMSDTEKDYYSALSAMDQQVGRLRGFLRDPNDDGDESDSIAENTLLFFTSDNGPEKTAPGASDGDGGVNSGALRGNKRYLWEGGVRVPGIVEWAGRIAPGETDSAMVTTDYLPTVMDVWGLNMPDDRPLDGQSMHETIFNDRSAQRSKAIKFEFKHRNARSIVRGPYKLISTDNGSTWALYDTEDNPLEKSASAVATSADIGSQPQEIQGLFNSVLSEFDGWYSDQTVDSRNGFDYDDRVDSDNTDSRVEVLFATPNDLVGNKSDLRGSPADQSENRRTGSGHTELIVERQFVTLERDLAVDLDGTPGTYSADTLPSSPMLIPRATVVDSFLFHYAPDTAGMIADVQLSFDDLILGVIGRTAGLNATDDLFAFADPAFSAMGTRGSLAGEDDGDQWVISPDGRTLTIAAEANATGLDQLRIFTRSSLQFQAADVPEPATLALMASALLTFLLKGATLAIASPGSLPSNAGSHRSNRSTVTN